MTISQETQPPKPSNDNNIIHSPESTSDAPGQQQYVNQPYYQNPYYQYQGQPNYPWLYAAQPQYYSQPNVGQQNAYVPSQLQQPEFEGFLVPVQIQPTRSQLPSLTQTAQTQLRPESSQSAVAQSSGATATPSSPANSESSKTPTSISNRHSFDLALLLQAILPQNIIQLIIVLGNFILNSFSTLAFAGAITSLLCSLTPVCTISFGSLPFGVRKILVNGTEISTIQRVRRAAEMVTNAIDKYEQIQKGVESLTHSLKQAQKKL